MKSGILDENQQKEIISPEVISYLSLILDLEWNLQKWTGELQKTKSNHKIKHIFLKQHKITFERGNWSIKMKWTILYLYSKSKLLPPPHLKIVNFLMDTYIKARKWNIDIKSKQPKTQKQQILKIMFPQTLYQWNTTTLDASH